MDFFKFESTTDPTNLDQGHMINELTSSLWVERYSEPGEFSFEAPLSAGLRDFLPLGTLISHADTYEVMIVENHEIKETGSDDPVLVITGRSFVSYLENRIVGMNAARAGSTITPYNIGASNTWTQIAQIINAHIFNPTSTNDALTNVTGSSSLTGTGTSVARTIDRGTVLERVLEILKVDDLGIRTIRRNTFGVGHATYTLIDIYRGVDNSSNVFFSWKSGDLSSVQYLFSNKGDKNSALVFGKYTWVMVDTAPTKYDRRMMVVDASDIEDGLNDPPTGATLTAVLNAMTIRGQQAIANQNRITIGQADVSETARFQYRRDYNIGDLISLDGNFGQIAVMRVVEYAEIQDENGESGHPTLALPGV